MDNTYKVYAKHKDNLVYHIYSTCFEEVQKGDVLIKQGYGDEFVHVGYYQIYDDNMCHNYKVVEGEVVETTEDEKHKEYEENKIDTCPPKTLEQRLEEMKQKLVETEQKLAESEEEKRLLKAQVEANTSTQEFLESCLMEVAKVVYA